MIHPDQDVQWLYLVFETVFFKHLPDSRIITMDPCTSEPRLQLEFGGDGNIYSCRMLPNNTTKVVVLGTRDDFLVCIEVVSLLHHIPTFMNGSVSMAISKWALTQQPSHWEQVL